jgi:hypothetical protein
MYLIAFPLLLLPSVLYNMVAFLLDVDFTTVLFSIPLLSGRSMAVNTGDLLVLFGIVLLYVEILKATRMSSKAIMDHVLSFVLFIAMIIEFIAVQAAATSTFLILIALSFVDVIGGFTVTIRTAQRDIALDRSEHMVSRADVRVPYIETATALGRSFRPQPRSVAAWSAVARRRLRVCGAPCAVATMRNERCRWPWIANARRCG